MVGLYRSVCDGWFVQECKAAQNQILKEFLQQVHLKKQQVSVSCYL